MCVCDYGECVWLVWVCGCVECVGVDAGSVCVAVGSVCMYVCDVYVCGRGSGKWVSGYGERYVGGCGECGCGCGECLRVWVECV